MDPSLPLFSYTPLPTKRHIRVIEVTPNDDKAATLKVHTRLVSLDDEDAVPYAALSYTWGLAEFTCPLIIDDALMWITPSLGAALRCFRQAGHLKWIWADAVCIDQHDDVEKTKQIPLMGQIYHQALYVQIWLGEDPRAVELLRSIRRAHLWYKSAARAFPDKEALCLRSNLQRFSELAWFSRRWVIQELAFSARAFFWCGSIKMSWAHILQLLDEDVIGDGIPDILRQLSALWDTESRPVKRNRSSIWTLMRNFDESECLDPRDRVFALLGLSRSKLPDERVSPRPRAPYYQTTAQIYTSLAAASIWDGQLCRVFTEALARRQPDGVVDLPSWAPDWTQLPDPKLMSHSFFFDTLSAEDGISQKDATIHPCFSGNYHILRARLNYSRERSQTQACSYEWQMRAAARYNSRRRVSRPLITPRRTVADHCPELPFKIVWKSTAVLPRGSRSQPEFDDYIALWAATTMISLYKFLSELYIWSAVSYEEWQLTNHLKQTREGVLWSAAVDLTLSHVLGSQKLSDMVRSNTNGQVGIETHDDLSVWVEDLSELVWHGFVAHPLRGSRRDDKGKMVDFPISESFFIVQVRTAQANQRSGCYGWGFAMGQYDLGDEILSIPSTHLSFILRPTKTIGITISRGRTRSERCAYQLIGVCKLRTLSSDDFRYPDLDQLSPTDAERLGIVVGMCDLVLV